MLRVFIGYDKRETVAFHVLSHSILARASIPVAIIPLNRDNLKGIYRRERGELESTDFSLSRFLVPYLCGYEGHAVFMDCDMVCVGDIAELGHYTSISEQYSYAVRVAKHRYVPKGATKFLGATQTDYEKKNWSSVILFNNALCRELTLEAVHNNSGLWLHQFKWTTEDRIGNLPPGWNHLVGENSEADMDALHQYPLKLIHYTLGTPCFAEYADCAHSDLWHKEREAMLHAA